MKPIIYLDTNICRDCIRNRSKTAHESIYLMQIIKNKKWNCITSAFTLMELYDIEKDDLFFNKKLRQGWDINKIIRSRNHKDLNQFDMNEIEDKIRIFYKEYPVNFHVLEGVEGWTLANEICASTNLSAPDSIHLAVAIGSTCHVLVTSDQEFINEGRKFLQQTNRENKMRMSTPDIVEDTLKKLIKDIDEDINEFPYHEDYTVLNIDEKIKDLLFNARIDRISYLINTDQKELMRITGLNSEEVRRLIEQTKKHYDTYKIQSD